MDINSHSVIFSLKFIIMMIHEWNTQVELLQIIFLWKKCIYKSKFQSQKCILFPRTSKLHLLLTLRVFSSEETEKQNSRIIQQLLNGVLTFTGYRNSLLSHRSCTLGHGHLLYVPQAPEVQKWRNSVVPSNEPTEIILSRTSLQAFCSAVSYNQ